jgi:ankyrin repeat protein
MSSAALTLCFAFVLMQLQDGDTALHFAVQSGHAAVARILITNHNARTTIKNNAGRLAADVAAGAARGMIPE